MSSPKVDPRMLGVLAEHRRGVLAVVQSNGRPHLSTVSYAYDRDADLVRISVTDSRVKTRHLRADPRASLLIMRPDVGEGDPQALPRATFQVSAAPLPADDPGYLDARAAYLARLPQQEYLFSFPDFALFRLTPASARYIGGFAKAFSLSSALIADALGER